MLMAAPYASAFCPDMPELLGDYNCDCTVGQLDHDFWKANFGKTVTPGTNADGSGDGVVNAADYNVWRKQLGAVCAFPDAGAHITQPLTVDLDNDGQKEILVVTGNIFPTMKPMNVALHVLSADRQERTDLGFPLVVGGFNLAVGDLNNDGGHLDIVVTDDTGQLSAFKFNGTAYKKSWSMRKPANVEVAPYSPMLTDLNGNGTLEVVAVERIFGSNTSIVAVGPDGGNISGWPYILESNTLIHGDLAAADLNTDGKSDVAFMAFKPGAPNPTRLMAVQGNGSILYSLENNTNDTSMLPLIGDVNGDRRLDVAYVSYKGHVFVVSSKPGPWTSTLIFSRPAAADGFTENAGALGDLDQNGDLEIVFAIGRKAYALNHQGNVLAGWPASMGSGLLTNTYGGNSGVSIGDVSGDKKPDVVINSIGTDPISTLYAFDHQGQMLPGWPYKITDDPIQMQTHSLGAANLSDLDADQDLEVVFSAFYFESGNGNPVPLGKNKVRVIQTGQPTAASTLYWPMFQQNSIRDGLFGEPDLFGDYNEDCQVTQADHDVWKASFGLTVTPFRRADGNGDATVDASDYVVWKDNLGARCAVAVQLVGDYDLDCDVDEADNDVYRANFGKSVPIFSGADGSGNGIVDAADYVAWRSNLGAQCATGNTAPEPEEPEPLQDVMRVTKAVFNPARGEKAEIVLQTGGIGVAALNAQASAADVRIIITDRHGRTVADYMTTMNSGTVTWDGRNQSQETVVSDVYFGKVIRDGRVDKFKVVIIK